MNQKLVYLAAQELIRRRKSREILVDESFPEQAAFVKDPSRFLTAICTRRAGKSHGLALKFFNAAKRHPKSLCPYIGLTRESAENIMWPVFKELNEKYNIGATLTVSDLEITLPNESKIKLFGADQRNFIERLRGPKYPFAAIDEAQSFREHIESLIDDVLTPAVADFVDGQIAMTGTPGPVPKGYFFDASQGKNGFKVHNWTVYQNPFFPRPREFAEELLVRKNWTKDHPTFRREWLGEWVSDPDALVYRFDRFRNLVDERPKGTQWLYVLGVDLGYDPDPSGFVLCAYNIYDRNLYIIDTYIQNKMTVSDVAERIKYYQKEHQYLQITIDAGAQGKMIAEEIRQRFGVPLIAAEKHGKAGFIEIMNSDFQNGLIKLVDEKTKELQDELMNLIWDSEKSTRVEDSRYSNHLCFVAGTMISTLDGKKPIEKLCCNDVLLTSKGYQSIKALGYTKKRDVIRLTINNGHNLICTADHPFWSLENGWKRADLLEKDDSLWSENMGSQKKFTFMEKFLDLILRVQTKILRIIIDHQTPKQRNQIFFIEKLGQYLMVLFQKGFIFIILMATLIIIQLKTLCLLIQKSIGKFMQMNIQKEEKTNWLEKIYRKLKLKQRNGINQTKADNGIVNTPKEWPRKYMRKNVKLNALFVEVLRLKQKLKKKSQNIVRQNVLQNLEENLDWMTLVVSVLIVRTYLQLINIQKLKPAQFHVVKKEKMPSSGVYTLSVNNKHEYFANGFLVSNCDAALYAWRYCYNYAATELIEKPKPNTEAFMEEWWEGEADRIAQIERQKKGDEWI